MCSILSQIIRRTVSSQLISIPPRNIKLRWLHSSKVLCKITPFDIDATADLNDEFNELNSMYTSMFSKSNSNNKDVHKVKTENSLVDDINELNDELNELCSPYDTRCGSQNVPKISGDDLKTLVENSGRFIMISLSNNPYFNLALEDYIYNNSGKASSITKSDNRNSFVNSERLMFYINDKCAVIGKNQTIWKELFMKNLYDNGYQVLRRFSGGGAVIHDLGNVNYSFLTSREDFRREFFNENIVKWLREQNPKLNINLNERGDITLDGYKVSGSAFKIGRGKSYHHGTMLINSRIDKFKGLLKPDELPNVKWNCNSINSVRSEITNLPLTSTKQFIDICIDGYKTHFQDSNIPVLYCDESDTMNIEIRKVMNKLMSYEWKATTGPPFEVQINTIDTQLTLTVEKGIIIKSTIPIFIGMPFQEFSRLSKALLQTDV
ncbi:hypothetical protein TPHA_0O01320 [Tetrapisispora phaffii CBS 4417]|uniref:Putative lipoate-protein ligase A n=1 Tax=Tetrapisispora phaffii (strain ATCC 24235 / CBS 4417 / NBRC 1672 / NRRL Y-8282 / UCD 70-5) TaxID=1071381 RepID=G8C1S2_TETPH|nr:hypothetical protein TPHA_0O01320 [Tetrapisispora phaffii CBS 4417]CCE66100.1 hypothetical protein TPHA_0O01320 [Tetrapisispora phaffii CBS 4417]